MAKGWKKMATINEIPKETPEHAQLVRNRFNAEIRKMDSAAYKKAEAERRKVMVAEAKGKKKK